MERCVVSLLPDGLPVTEIEPGVDLVGNSRGRVPISLRVRAELRVMDERLFRPECSGQALQASTGTGSGVLSTSGRERAVLVGRD